MLGINAIKITPEILLQVAEIDEFKGLWLGLDRHTTGLQLLGDVADYGAKFKSVLGPLQEHPISREMITILHDNKYPEHKGYKTDVHPLEILQGAEVAGQLDTAPPEQVGALLGKLCEWVNDVLKAGEMHPLIIAAVFTAVFLQIAPFDKGNKEIAQFLIVLIMLKKGYDYVEGYLVTEKNKFIAHAWNIDKEGNHIDFTLESNDMYNLYSRSTKNESENYNNL